jgi:hypothetical protein
VSHPLVRAASRTPDPLEYRPCGATRRPGSRWTCREDAGHPVDSGHRDAMGDRWHDPEPEASFVGYLTTDAGTPMVGLVGPLALASIEGEALARAGRRRRLLGWLGLGLGRRVA